MPPEPNDLLIFARVVEAGGFGRAAERLGLPKSTVSRRISALEAALGERLLQRTTRKLVVTEFGQQLLGPAREIVSETEQAVALAESSRGRVTGRLRVSMPTDLSAVLSATVARFVTDHPAVQLELDLTSRRVDLIAESFDVAIRTGALADDPYLAVRHLADLTGGLCAGPKYLRRTSAPVHPDDLTAHAGLHLIGRDGEPTPWVLGAGPDLWSGVLVKRTLANAYDLLTWLAIEGAGVAALLDLFAKPHLRSGALVALMPQWRMRPSPIWAVFPSRKFVPLKTRAFVEAIKAALDNAE
jgi:DNA-binding transcriptional LysR family regulator